ncbi:hypothetical protein L5515_002725 [Caenorhabditis briggsae]|nr:hypothetical protein L5515_002725 [Caenorhabditis briggsae]
MLAYLPDLFFFSSDGPQERWHMRRAVEEWDTNKRPDMAYHAIFQAANARLQKYFLAMGARIQHEKARDWAVNHLFDETIKKDISFDGVESMGKTLDAGWNSACRWNKHRKRTADPSLPPMGDPETWKTDFKNVTNFLDGLDALATHELLKEDLLKALIESPLPENIGYVKETWEETYEGEKYTVNHHWNLFGTHREDPSLKMPKMG